MKKRYPHKSNILLVNITRLGDMLQATPTIAGLKMENPDCRITVLVEKQFEDVCHCIPNIDVVKGLDLGMTVRSIAREQDGIVDAFEYLTEAVGELREEKFDYCLNMSSSAYTALLLNLIGIKRNGGWTSDEEGYRVIESDWARLFATSVFHQNRSFNSLNLVDMFRCSADVDQHPQKLLIRVDSADHEFARKAIADAEFTNRGPLIAVQAGASQGKRQWAPAQFVEFIKVLVNEHDARVIMIGSGKERSIIDPIVTGCDSPNVKSIAGGTTIPQLAAVLEEATLLVTGDTGPMHMSVAVGTPVVAMFLASAYGFETGPYSAGNLVLQPVIECGPCNPNKSCSRPDCHDSIEPRTLAELTMMRTAGDVIAVPDGMFDPRTVVLYRSGFDKFGFCELAPLNTKKPDANARYRQAYRHLWLDDLGGFQADATEMNSVVNSVVKPTGNALKIVDGAIDGLAEVERCASQGKLLINELVRLIEDARAPGASLGKVNRSLGELDKNIEQLGFHFAPLGPLSRMFVFGKENISGSDPLVLASQTYGIYDDLERRCRKFADYYQQVS